MRPKIPFPNAQGPRESSLRDNGMSNEAKKRGKTAHRARTVVSMQVRRRRGLLRSGLRRCSRAYRSTARACMYVCVGRIRCISCSDSPTFETRQREKGKDNLTMHMAEVFPWLASLDCDCFHLTSKAATARDLFINYSDGLGISL